jgi:hypothetical protein
MRKKHGSVANRGESFLRESPKLYRKLDSIVAYLTRENAIVVEVSYLVAQRISKAKNIQLLA